MKKIFTLVALVVLLIQSSVVQSQERLWGIASGAIFSVNKDGTDYTSTRLLGGGTGNAVIGYAKTPNGIIYVTHDDDTEEGDIGVLNQTGTHYFYHHSYLGPRGAEGMTYTYDGKVYMPARSVMSSKMTGIRITDPFGSTLVTQGFTNSSFLSSEVYLTATSEGVFGVSSGTTGNYGGIFKLSSDAKSIQIIHQFTAASPGTRATGKLVEGTDGTLFGETLRGGTNDKGIYFKINKDGSNLTKIGDKADGQINTPNAQGKYQRLVDFIALGYSPLRDSDGVIYLSTANGVFKIGNDGTPLLKVVQWGGESLSFISSPISHGVKVNNLASGSTNVSTNLNLTLDSFAGASFYEIQVSTTPDFSSDVQFQRHPVPSFNFSLAGNTTYYVRARPMTWPYFGEVTTFKTQISFDLSKERIWGTRSTSIYGPQATNDKIIFSMKKDGTDYIEHEGNIGGFKLLQDGSVLTTDVSDGERHVMRKITKDGSNFLYELERYSGNTLGYTLGTSMVEVGNGQLMGFYARFGDKVRGTSVIAEDGSNYNRQGFSSSANLSADFYLAKTDNGVYGLSRGDTNNKGFVFRVKDDRSGFDVVYQFQGLDDGRAPFGKITRGNDNFLYASTLRGGKDNAGIVFKVKDDGTNFTKLFDRADGDIDARAVDGKFFRLLEFLNAGYPGVVTDSDGFHYLATATGLWKIRPDGYAETQLSSSGLVQHVELIAPAFKSGTVVNNIADGAFGVPTNLTLVTDSFPGAEKYYFELSKSSDFSTINFSLNSNTTHVGVQGLDAGTKYYTRVRPNVWPYFDKVISFTTTQNTPSNDVSNLVLETYEETFYADKDGAHALELTYKKYDEYDWGGDAEVLQLSTGEILASRAFVLSKISKNGLTKLYDLDYDEFYGGSRSWVEKDGYLYILNYNIMGSELRGVTRLKLDGTQRDTHLFTVQDLHRGPGLTALNEGVYGANDNVGDASGYIFRINDDLSGITITYNFTDGMKPMGRLLDGGDGFMYGVTRNGGDNNGGVIYRVKPDGSAFEVLHHFTTTTGRGPVVGLVRGNDGLLYGATRIGGLSGKGVVFRIHDDGTGYEVILHLANAGGEFIETPLSIDEELNIYGVAGGIGFFKLEGNSSSVLVVSNERYPRTISLLREAFTPEVAVTSPADQSSNVATTTTFAVNEMAGADRYQIEISESPLFSGAPMVFNSDTTLVAVSGLTPSTTYFARVRTGLCPFFGAVTSFTTSSSPTVALAARTLQADAYETKDIPAAFPNPSYDRFTLAFSEADDAISVTVSNASGIVVYENKNLIPGTSLSFGETFGRGVYFLKVRTRNDVKTSRLVKN